MERKRKGYLLRKSVTFDLHKPPQTSSLPCVSTNGHSSSRTYDLQTQTVTFEEESDHPIENNKLPCSSSPQLNKCPSEEAHKSQKKPLEMDSELEFYPVDDHPSPSTFTAWDAFLSGNQAFFREPACAYMDVIPEEEDDLEALIESDTDDTGSSVSTVVDRFSRASTANSSFSERCSGTAFDLEKVLSPFERLEKELDAHQGTKDEEGWNRKKDIPRGPIVVITNSSSCEDVHSDPDEHPLPVAKTTNSDERGPSQNDTELEPVASEPPAPNSATAPVDANSSLPPVPSRTKLVNGHKGPEKSVAKKAKNDKIIPLIPPPSHPKKKRSYPTPSVPPRMSTHLPARRTRSDPGSPDQPSRIPRPISTANRSPVAAPAPSPKGAYKFNRTSTPKKLAFVESPKTNRSTSTTKISSSVVESSSNGSSSFPIQFNDENSIAEDNFQVPNDIKNGVDDTDSERIDSSQQRDLESETEPFPDIVRSASEDSVAVKEVQPVDESVVATDNSNPFQRSETNPFRKEGENNNPFAKGKNPFEDDAPTESTPALQPKGQISAAINAPPIPERPSLLSHPRRDKTPEDAISTDSTCQFEANLQEPKDNVPLESDTSAPSEPTVIESTPAEPRKSFWPVPKESTESPDQNPLCNKDAPQRPIEDILQALDQLVLSSPREVEISIDWGARGPVNIREKAVLPSSTASCEGSETDGLTEDRQRCIETLLKEVDECLRMHKVREEPIDEAASTDFHSQERTPLGPGTPDVPTAGSTAPNLQHDIHAPAKDILSEHSLPEMLRHQKHDILGLRDSFPSAYPLEQDSKHHSPGCDDSGVFLEDPVLSSPETPSKSGRLRDDPMRQYALPEPLDSDAEKSDDLGLASSSVDSADDLDGDPLPSTLPLRQKPPPVPARKSLVRPHEAPPQVPKPPLSKSSSSGEDSNFGEGDPYTNNDDPFYTNENAKNLLNQEKNGKYEDAVTLQLTQQQQRIKDSFPPKSSYGKYDSHQQRDDGQESKTNFLARTLSSGSPLKQQQQLLELPTKQGEYASSLKWKSEECLRTAAENKWSLPGRRYEKSVSVKDRIAMFSEMESNQATGKKDLQRYGSENNIKSVATPVESKKADASIMDDRKTNSLLRDSKWQSMQNIDKKYTGRDMPYTTPSIKPALSIPSLLSSSPIDSVTNNVYAPFPIKLDVEPPKPIVSTYPETQLTNNKRYNYGLYSLKNLKNTEDLLSKKAAGSNLLSIIDNRKQPLRKLKGLVIPDKPLPPESGKTLPTIVSSDSENSKDSRRASLPITVVTACSNSMSLPRNKRLECQKQISMTEPPWKTERSSNHSTNTLPKYSPAFKKRSLELPGSSLSPTPPSSLTSPLSPPPSSPSSVCSSNASSSLQQNVFQFSLSHSKPVKPLLPEKALMSPPGELDDEVRPIPTTVSVSEPKEEPELQPIQQTTGQNLLHYGAPNVFTSSSTKSVALQPLLVEALVKTPSPCPPPRAAVCISKTEIHLRRDAPRTAQEGDVESPTKKTPTEFSTVIEYTVTQSSKTTTDSARTSQPLDYFNGQAATTNDRSPSHQNGSRKHSRPEVLSPEVPSVGKFRASPLHLPKQETTCRDKSRDRRPLLPSECDDSDDDSHSTLSHRTTDECLSDATTDSFEKPRPAGLLLPRPAAYDDSASTEGYLSDASTDVSLRRFAHRPIDGPYSAEEYLSDATAESPDPDWMSNRGHADSRYRGHLRNNESCREDSDSVDPDLRPKRLSQQRTVLRASVEPSGSVQKFKALAEKWEQRVVSPPPPPVTAAPVNLKRDARTVVQSHSAAPAPKGKSSSLPPSLMPRNARAPASRQHTSPTTPPETNGWSQHEEMGRATRSDSTSSDSSKTTVKEEEMPEIPLSPVQPEVVDPKELTATAPLSNGHRTPSPPKPSWNNEPRNRRGADFSWSSRPNFAAKSSVSDIRRSFENGHKEPTVLAKKPTPSSTAVVAPSPVVATPRVSVPDVVSSLPEEEEELLEAARRQLQDEGCCGQRAVLAIKLLREGGMDGGSVGITLAGGADYEVKEITVHKVIAGSIADRDGRVLKGDRLMSINGRDLRGVSHGEALHILKAPNPRVLLVVARSTTQMQQQTTAVTKQSRPPTDAESFLVELQKDATGLGFSIEGGKDSPQGDRPLLIKRVFKGGAADKEGQLGEGDEIVSVNSHPMTNMTRTEAWNYLKKLPEGPVRLQLRKNRLLAFS